MDSNPKELKLSPDEGAAQLFKTDGKTIDLGQKRYHKAYSDIVNRYLVPETAPAEQVVVMVGHSCGINPFLKEFGYQGEALRSPCYCATM
eukprot:CAMPEP_0170499880 /NCGR_PEP_ID=MMETSP0208-20121228/32957_1 /TAXON_ID=197538 /ORGANISM="Strombidium inclinatum, Strain S3" /LENGTH=89 /DNA_ID=CAMNT_0010777637 /DNA_START=298 /DNA_END=564 /DNA_ORIENTATION=-